MPTEIAPWETPAATPVSNEVAPWETPAATPVSNEVAPWETPAAPAVKKPSKTSGVAPAKDGRGAILSLFPSAYVTDWKRDPNSNLGRANTTSFHNRRDSAGAVDIRRIPGMSFNDYVSKIREAGYPIIEARDEYENPSPHATGPHWHVTIGEREGSAPAATEALQGASTGGYEYVEDTPTEGTPRRNEMGSLKSNELGRDEAVTRSDQTVIDDAVAKEVDYVEKLVLDARANGVPYEEVESTLRARYPTWYNKKRTRNNIRAFYDTGIINWAVDPSAPELNQNVGEDIIVVGEKKSDLDYKTQFLSDRAELSQTTSVTGLLKRLEDRIDYGLYGIGKPIDEQVDEERLKRGDLEASLANNPYGAHWSDKVMGFGADIVGGVGPDYLLPGAVGKSSLQRAVSAPVLAAGVDAGIQGAENLEGVSEGFDYNRNLMNAAVGGVTQVGMEGGAALIKNYRSRNLSVETFDNPNVVGVDEPATTGNTPRGKVNKKQASVAAEVAKTTEGWVNPPEIIVHGSKGSFTKAEPELAEKLRQDKVDNRAPGFYGEDGRLHVLAYNVKDVSNVKSLVFHEALGHDGLAKSLGGDLDNVLNDLYTRNPTLRREADALGAGLYKGIYTGDDALARLTEEALAKRSEAGVISTGIIDRFRAAIAPYVRKLGLTMDLSDAEVKAILADAHAMITKGGKAADGASASGLRYVLTTHVSPHDFENIDDENPYGKFDHSKMGTGEGAQVYSWGTYLGENTRDNYFRKFSREMGSGAKIGDTPVSQHLEAYFEKDFSARPSYVYNATKMVDEDFSYYSQNKEDYKSTADFVNKQLDNYLFSRGELDARSKENPGNSYFTVERDKIDYIIDAYRNLSGEYIELGGKAPKTYEVDVTDELQERMLKWDKTFDDQPQAVKDVINELGIEHVSKERMLELEDERAQADDTARDYYEKNVQPVYDEAQRKGDALYEDTFAEIISSEKSLLAAYNTFKDKLPGRREMMGRQARDQGVFDGPSYKAKPLENLSVEEITELVGDIAWRKVDRKIGDWTRVQLKDILPEYRRLAKKYDDVQEKIDSARYLTGESIYSAVVREKGSPKAASEYLAEKGIPGNKYEDGFSRGKYGDKSYNYVMYNDKGPDAPKIINKYMLEDDLPQRTVKKFMTAMKGARLLNEKFTEDVKADTKAKAKALAKARRSTSGEAGLYARLKALEGKTTRPAIEPFRDKFTQKEADALFKIFDDPNHYQGFEGVNAGVAFKKLLDGKVPMKSEFDLLARVLPKDFIKYALELRTMKVKLGDAFIEGVNIPRALMASVDLSAPFRQGLFLVSRGAFWKNFPSMFRHAWSQEFHDAQMAEIRGRDSYPLMQKANLALTEMGVDAHLREEDFMATTPEKWVGIGRLVKGSNRAYTGFLNQLRADVFDDIVKTGMRKGVDFNSDVKALRSLGGYINDATGRASLGKTLDKHAPLLNAVFFSARLIASRVKLLTNVANPAWYVKTHPLVRAQYFRDLIGFGGIAVSLAALADFGGADVEWDPRSSDFLKIRVGKTRYDIFGGFSQYLTLGARLSPEIVGGNHTKTLKGEVKKLNDGPYGPGTRGDVTARFLRNKLAPVPSYVADFLFEKNPVGDEFHPGKDALKRVVPLFIQDLKKGYDEEGYPGLAKALPSGLGIGSSTYDQVPAKYDPLGRDPEAVKDGDPVSTELDRLSKLNEDERPVIGWVTKSNLPKGPVRDAADPKDIEALQKLSGDYIYADLKQEMASPEWDKLTDEEKVELVNKIERDQRKNAREDLFPEAETEDQAPWTYE